MNNDKNKRLKTLYIVFLIVLILVGVTSVANRISKAKYEAAMSQLNELLSDPDSSSEEDLQESKITT